GAVDLEDEVLGPDAGAVGRAVADHLDDLDAAVVAAAIAGGRRHGPGPAGDAEVGPADAPLAHQRADHAQGVVVDRHREAEADAGDRRVHPDHAAAAVRERAAGVAWVEGGVGLDDVVDDPPGAARARWQRAAERGHHPGRDRALEAVRIADRHHELADAQLRGVAQLRGLETFLARSQDGQIRERVPADDLEAV